MSLNVHLVVHLRSAVPIPVQEVGLVHNVYAWRSLRL